MQAVTARASLQLPVIFRRQLVLVQCSVWLKTSVVLALLMRGLNARARVCPLENHMDACANDTRASIDQAQIDDNDGWRIVRAEAAKYAAAK